MILLYPAQMDKRFQSTAYCSIITKGEIQDCKNLMIQNRVTNDYSPLINVCKMFLWLSGRALR